MYFIYVGLVKKAPMFFKSFGYDRVFFKYLNYKKENEKYAMFVGIYILWRIYFICLLFRKSYS